MVSFRCRYLHFIFPLKQIMLVVCGVGIETRDISRL